MAKWVSKHCNLEIDTSFLIDVQVIRDFKDTIYPLFESYTLFLDFILVLFLGVWRFFESRDV